MTTLSNLKRPSSVMVPTTALYHHCLFYLSVSLVCLFLFFLFFFALLFLLSRVLRLCLLFSSYSIFISLAWHNANLCVASSHFCVHLQLNCYIVVLHLQYFDGAEIKDTAILLLLDFLPLFDCFVLINRIKMRLHDCETS